MHTRMRLEHENWYPAIGVLFGLGAPLGFLVLRATLQTQIPGLGWLWQEITSQVATYGYLTLSTCVVLAILGGLVGEQCSRLRASSLVDRLTGLWNQRYLETRLDEEVRRARRHTTPLSILAVDVDGLRQVNEQRGHDAGDQVLRRVGQAIRAACRRTDIPARVGGDEFIVIAPNSQVYDAVRLADRMRQAVARASEGAGPSISIGVAGLADLSTSEQEELLAQVEDALIRAQELGGDRIVSAADLRMIEGE